MAQDKYTPDADFVQSLKVGREALDKEFQQEEIKAVDIPSHLTKKLSQSLLLQKEKAVNQVVAQF